MNLSLMQRAALAYVERDEPLPIFATMDKVPLLESRGELDATTDPRVIYDTWRRHPDAAPAVALRFTQNFVLDCDARNFGHEWLEHLQHEHGELPHTATAISGSGWPSAHYWFKRPAALEGMRCKRLEPKDQREGEPVNLGLDIKGVNAGYIVLPPALHSSGRRYCWDIAARFGEVPIADPPAWLTSMILTKAVRARKYKSFAEPVDPESFRLGWLFKRMDWLGCQIKNGVFAVLCPNQHRHNRGRPYDGSTVLFAPEIPHERGTFFCSHTSICEGALR